jgi:hypothetical protein
VLHRCTARASLHQIRLENCYSAYRGRNNGSSLIDRFQRLCPGKTDWNFVGFNQAGGARTHSSC